MTASASNVRAIPEIAVRTGVLEQHAEILALVQRFAGFGHHDVDIEVLGPVFQDVQGLRQNGRVDQETAGFRLAVHPLEHGHGFRRGGGFVQQGCIGDRHAGQVADHLLEVQKRFEPALGNFCLVGRVGCVPARIFQYVALNDRRQDGFVIPQADHIVLNLVQTGNFPQFRQCAGFTHRIRQVQCFIQLYRGRQCPCDQLFQRRDSDLSQHFFHMFVTRSDMPHDEFIVVFQAR
jgi:hypothetical protein